MSGGTFEKLFGAWTAAEADLYEALISGRRSTAPSGRKSSS
jgi:hypothetical protein